MKHKYIYGGKLSRAHVVGLESLSFPYRIITFCGRSLGFHFNEKITVPRWRPPTSAEFCERCRRVLDARRQRADSGGRCLEGRYGS